MVSELFLQWTNYVCWKYDTSKHTVNRCECCKTGLIVTVMVHLTSPWNMLQFTNSKHHITWWIILKWPLKRVSSIVPSQIFWRYVHVHDAICIILTDWEVNMASPGLGSCLLTFIFSIWKFCLVRIPSSVITFILPLFVLL